MYVYLIISKVPKSSWDVSKNKETAWKLPILRTCWSFRESHRCTSWKQTIWKRYSCTKQIWKIEKGIYCYHILFKIIVSMCINTLHLICSCVDYFKVPSLVNKLLFKRHLLPNSYPKNLFKRSTIWSISGKSHRKKPMAVKKYYYLWIEDWMKMCS